jgi:hypothetical protein
MSKFKNNQCNIFGLLLMAASFVYSDNVVALAVFLSGAFLCWGIQEILDQLKELKSNV